MFIGSKPIKILFVEDEHSDSIKFETIFNDISYFAKIKVLKDGDLVTQYLFKALDGDLGSDIPDLILIDLNYPITSAFTTLNQIKGTAEFRRIPVIILSSDNDAELVKKSYELLANSFVEKPKDADAFVEMVKSIEAFWLKTVSLPTIT